MDQNIHHLAMWTEITFDRDVDVEYTSDTRGIVTVYFNHHTSFIRIATELIPQPVPRTWPHEIQSFARNGRRLFYSLFIGAPLLKPEEADDLGRSEVSCLAVFHCMTIREVKNLVFERVQRVKFSDETQEILAREDRRNVKVG